jgi:hypothetical protein
MKRILEVSAVNWNNMKGMKKINHSVEKEGADC